tara:strand:+ start:375 stop:740 length:366 start_codon:yes stop_codon:yes gene_type:complete
MNPDDCVITVNTDTTDSYYSYGSNNYSIEVGDLIDYSSNTITLDEPDSDFVVLGDIIQQPPNGDRINVTEIIHEQKLQIESLSDMIKEMVETKNFNIEWDLDRRVEQKKFLNKLGEDPNDL